jgi:hypothetical protein
MLINRLRDVRPYLYYVGWWTAEETWALTGEGWDQYEFEQWNLLGLKMATSDWVESICYDSKRKKWGE